ncbi:MAG: DUF559 domain-containing protein [Synechococcaceae cyanobacterium SM2_3_2]|nr:DUF559 domain-containing protein [Synechococcaceae cyanobacterium SM2_3_2]
MSRLAVVADATAGHTLKTTLLLKVLSHLTPETRWTSDWLHTNIRESRRPFAFGPYQICYGGQPGGRGSEHQWQIISDQPQAAAHLDAILSAIRTRSQLPVLATPPRRATGQTQPGSYRSEAEATLGDVLEARGILFYANSRCRIRNRAGITLTQEPDFLVIVGGKARILEVDGREYHQDAGKDHQRDRLFDRYGLRCSRFSAKECLQDPEAVVDEFMDLFGGGH